MLDSGQLRWESCMRNETESTYTTRAPVIFYSPEVLRGIIRRFETIPPSISPEEIPRFLPSLQTRIRSGERPRLYTVFNYSDVHWLALEIDFDKRLIRYGDSMGGHQSSSRVRNILKAWLKATWGYEDFKSEEMPSCTQSNDTTSCGVCTINTIEVQIFGDKLWEEDLAAAYRASKFIEIAHRVLHMSGIYASSTPAFTIQDALNESQDKPTTTQHDNWPNVPDLPSSPPPSSVPPSSPGDLSECDLSGAPDVAKSDNSGSAPERQLPNELLYRNFLAIESASDSSSCSSSKSTRRPKKRQKPGKSMAHTQVVMEAVHTGNFKIDETRWARFETTIKELDAHAVLDQNDPLYVRHSICGNSFKMRQPYDVKNFKQHVNAKTCQLKKAGASVVGKSKKSEQSPGAGMLPLTAFAGFKRRSDRSISVGVGTPTPESHPTGTEPAQSVTPMGPGSSSQQEIIRVCPGISEANMPGLSNYLLRTMYIGGGSRAYGHFATALYSTTYMELGENDQLKVQNEAHGNVAWRVDESRNVVVASSCTRVARGVGVQNSELRPCENCSAVLKLPGFRAAVKYEARPNQKFTNKRWMKVSSGMQFAKVHGVYELIVNKDGRTPAQRFLLRVLQGEMKDRSVFCGMVEVIAMMDDKAARGVGLHNAKYPPDFDQFCHEIVNISPLAYHTFRSVFGGRTASSFREIRARERRFPLAIDDSVYELAENYLSSVGYKGPVSLACDDTKLMPALKTYYDASTKQWYLLGGTTGAIAIGSTEELTSILKEGKVSKAPKIRLWVLQVPLPHIPPLAIAALPIASTVTTRSLIGYLQSIIQGLLDRGIHVISYATDGSAVEQNIQEAFFVSMDHYQHYSIPHPSQRLSNGTSTEPPLDFKLGLLDGKLKDNPCVMVQDQKHALKTFRNNLYSGARLLVLGAEPAMYSQVREIAEDPESTLHKRDVEGVDRQDDGSSECVFNQLTLKFVVQRRPQYLGLIIFLYVLGELCDAYQSRHISHADRVWMALRAKFFIDFWRQFLQTSGYMLSRYFISQQASNILLTVVEGLILLIYAYRDYTPDGTPFLPWLHSSEACEHFFAEMRKLVPDFTYLDFVFSAPKLRVLLRASYRRNPEFSETLAEHQKKATGYRHTYMDSRNVNLGLLASFPTDGEMAEIAYVAYREAILLAQAVNILPDDQIPNLVPPPMAKEEPTEEVDLDTTNESESALSTGEAFQELVELADAHDLPLESVSIQRDNLVYASAALQAETTSLIDNLPSEGDLDIENDRTTIRQHTNSASEMVDPDLVESRLKEIDEEAFPQYRSTVELNLMGLVQIRQRHQNPRALKSSKNYAKFMAGTLDISVSQPKEPGSTQSTPGSAAEGSLGKPPPETTHASLARSFLQTLRDHETSGNKISPRLQRWIASGVETDGQFSGNTANAKKASEARANTYVKIRRDSLRERGIPKLLEELATARISTIKPIKPGTFVWILSERQIMLARVMAIYIKEGG
ncbi:hypothetical protein FRC11_007462, partial [Ceratobasidium sp. 423]